MYRYKHKHAKRLNYILGGGGIKGIAYIGVFDAAERQGFTPGNLAGVSAGAVAAALAGSGYDAAGMWQTLEGLEFEKLQPDTVKKRVPAVRVLSEYAMRSRLPPELLLWAFLNQSFYRARLSWHSGMDQRKNEAPDRLGNIIKSILAYCREGCLYDGDVLEEWVASALAKKGIRTFADLRGGSTDERNPSGYRVRMTGVDCNRLKIVTLPDDVVYYGMDPDRFEVAKAIRISTAIPFIFKPVTLFRTEGSKSIPCNLVDGGVLDSFPTWLTGSSTTDTLAFKLRSTGNINLGTPLDILKGLVTTVHDVGIPLENDKISVHTRTGIIDTGNITFLDFGLSEEEKQMLRQSGSKTAQELLVTNGSTSW